MQNISACRDDTYEAIFASFIPHKYCTIFIPLLSRLKTKTPKRLKTFVSRPTISESGSGGYIAVLPPGSYICFLPLHMWIFLFSYHYSHWQWGQVRPFLTLKMQAVKSLHLNYSTYSQRPLPRPSNYKENKKNLSQLIWMSKQGLTAGLSDSYLLTAVQ